MSRNILIYMSLRNKTLAAIIVCLTWAFSLMGEGATLHPVKRGEKYGYANEQGKMVITPRFTIAMDFGEGMAYVVEGQDKHGSWKHGFINENGRWVVFLDGKSFRPATQEEGYGERSDFVVFANGFAELPSYNSTGGKDFESSSVWINRNQMLEMVERFGKETPIRATSRIFFTQLLKDETHVLGVCAKARNTKGPNGILAFDIKEKKPVTTIQAGEQNEWFGSFGIMRYTGNTYLVYRDGNKKVRYFDEVTVLQDSKGELEILGKVLGGPYRLYTADIEEVEQDTFKTVGDFMKSHKNHYIRETADYVTDLSELQSRKMMDFRTMEDMERYYLTDGERFNAGKTPVCNVVKGEAKEKVRIQTRCGVVMLTGYARDTKEAWLWDFSSNSKMKVKMPLEIDASGNDGENGEAGSAGVAGRPKLTYREGNITKTEPGTCGEAGEDGEDGKDGENGATLMVIIEGKIPTGEVTVKVEAGKGGKGGKGGVGGIHGNGSPCKGKAKDGKNGRDGKDGKKGEVKIVRFGE
ncbi:MAG: WG repeat-containing protein [Paludibacteraceae bacterium]|nr:WG repeat-containing protein [Paludibacteraceae bacterium]